MLCLLWNHIQKMKLFLVSPGFETLTMCIYIYTYCYYMSILSIYPCTKHQRLHRAGHLRLVSGFAPAGWNGWLSRSHLSRAKMALCENGILHICLGLENWIIIDGYFLPPKSGII
jgi:hypothetical protein